MDIFQGKEHQGYLTEGAQGDIQRTNCTLQQYSCCETIYYLFPIKNIKMIVLLLFLIFIVSDVCSFRVSHDAAALDVLRNPGTCNHLSWSKFFLVHFFSITFSDPKISFQTCFAAEMMALYFYPYNSSRALFSLFHV